MLVAAGLLFWAPWRSSPADGASDGVVAADPSAPSAAAGGATAPGAVASGSASSAAATGAIVPTRLAIPKIAVNTAVESRGTQRYTNPFTGKAVSGYGVPKSMRTVSWWSDGPRPGSGQMAVVLGHTQVGGYGVFNRLAQLRPGDDVTFTSSDGSVLRLKVLNAPLTGLDKSTSALADALNGHPAGADVALVTCGGPFDTSAGQSEDNDVVFATVVRS
jgi:sortase (surface protein transpeptidase)